MVLEAVSVAHSAVGSEARSLERLCSAAAQNGAFQGLQLPEKDFAYKLLATTRALIHHGNLRQAEEQLAPHAPSNSRSRTPSVPVASPRRHRSRSRSPDARPAKNSKLTPEAFWGPQNSALFPTEDRSAREPQVIIFVTLKPRNASQRDGSSPHSSSCDSDRHCRTRKSDTTPLTTER